MPKKKGMQVRIVKQTQQAPVNKADVSTQVSEQEAFNAGDWIEPQNDLRGLRNLVKNSTILPQCIKAYKNNIAGFGIGVRYIEDEKETEAMRTEFSKMQQIIELLNLEQDTKGVFENVVEAREMYGIAYVEVIRNLAGEVVQLEFIKDTVTMRKTKPLEPYIATTYYHHDQQVERKKRYCKYRQEVGGKTVYFKEFGDPRIMDNRDGKYLTTGETLELEYQANEIMEFALGTEPYGEVRWIGQVLTVDGNRRAEVLNNSYFRKGRHTPLMILVKGGTLSDDAFTKLQAYMNEIEGEKGQHSFLVLETDTSETATTLGEQKQPEVEIKDLAAILQKDELFQEYQENGRKKTQSAFLLPDLYVGYTTDFNRATAQTAMEVTEKQVFQPERKSLAWIVNNKLLNGYRFKYVEAQFDEPDITNPDDIQKMLNITERAGGLTPNTAKELTYKVIGKDGCEDYEGSWGDTPLAYSKTMPQGQLTQDSSVNPVGNLKTDVNEPTGQHMKRQDNKMVVTEGEMQQLDNQIQKAAFSDGDIVPVMLEIRKALMGYRQKAGE